MKKFFSKIKYSLFSLLFTTITISAQSASASGVDSVVFTSSNLPIIIINTHGQTIVDDPKIEVDMGVIYNGVGVRNKMTDPWNHYNGKAGIEIRGSSSQQFPKKSYSVETHDSVGGDNKVALLGMPSEADWVFYATYNEKTLMRDVLMYDLSNNMGRYAPRSRHFELVLNGKYMGVYVLLEKIKRGSSRVNISKITSTDTTGDNLTGGYIFETDRTDAAVNSWWNSLYLPYPNAWQKITYQHVYPKGPDLAAKQLTYLRSWVTTVENAFVPSTYTDTVTGYNKVIDVSSFVDHFILEEFARNVDAYRLSAYMHKDKDSKSTKLFAGPVWDFNISLGNCDYYNTWRSDGWQIDELSINPQFIQQDGTQVPFWWKKLWADRAFKVKVANRLRQVRQNYLTTATLNAKIDSLVVLLNESQQRNFVKWPVLGTYVWPNYYIGQTFTDEVNYLKLWISQRIAWLDASADVILDAEEGANLNPSGYKLHNNYPNPFNPSTEIKYNLEKAGNVSLIVYDILGNEVSRLVNNEQNAGEHSVKFDAKDLASGVYIYKLNVNGFTDSNKMLLMK